jgi:hypothetical protein
MAFQSQTYLKKDLQNDVREKKDVRTDIIDQEKFG